jgi:hypothetical protein
MSKSAAFKMESRSMRWLVVVAALFASIDLTHAVVCDGDVVRPPIRTAA